MAKRKSESAGGRRLQHPGRRFERGTPTLKSWGEAPPRTLDGRKLPPDVVLDCGWGRLIFGHTFRDPARLAATLAGEAPGARDIALYLRDPHVVLSLAPQELFLDPSHTYRLWLSDLRADRGGRRAFTVQRVQGRDEVQAMNRIYLSRGMVPPGEDFVWEHRRSRTFTYLVARASKDDAVIGAVIGVDHVHAFDDPENGCSLWCLAVDPQGSLPGVGEALVRRLAEHYAGRGRAFMDLSVMHDNQQAIALYEKLGFQRVPVFCMKTRNAINEKLYSGPEFEPELNPYARILIDEARRRGIAVEVLDAEAAYFRLSYGGRAIVCRESLSELTTAIALSRCDDKAVTSRILRRAGLRVPAQVQAGTQEQDRAFLHEHRRLVVKPSRGEQGAGISVDVRTEDELQAAIERARAQGADVLLEEFVEGLDLRIVVIDYRVVAAAIRRPPRIVGTGRHTIARLIEKQSRRRAAATGGESRIPLDGETRRVVEAAGHTLEDVLPEGEELVVRKTANLHTGGSIHDVTDRLHPALARAAVAAARALDIPVTGLDFLVPSEEGETYAIVEANERPGLANHEPQPTAERFIDLLFPQTARAH